jgi:hypothetical protein
MAAGGATEPGGRASLASPPSISARAADREPPARRGGGGLHQLVLTVGDEQAASRIGTAVAAMGAMEGVASFWEGQHARVCTRV